MGEGGRGGEVGRGKAPDTGEVPGQAQPFYPRPNSWVNRRTAPVLPQT